MSDFCQHTERKARKDHVCCNCKQAINKGTKYIYISGVWEAEPASFKCCATCFHVLKNARLFDDTLFDDEMPCVDGLIEWFDGWMHESWNGEVAAADIAKCFSIPIEHARILARVEP